MWYKIDFEDGCFKVVGCDNLHEAVKFAESIAPEEEYRIKEYESYEAIWGNDYLA